MNCGIGHIPSAVAVFVSGTRSCGNSVSVCRTFHGAIPLPLYHNPAAAVVRLFEDLRGRYTSERLSLLSDAESLQSERRRLVVQLTEAATQRAAAETRLRAANKTIM